MVSKEFGLLVALKAQDGKFIFRSLVWDSGACDLSVMRSKFTY